MRLHLTITPAEADWIDRCIDDLDDVTRQDYVRALMRAAHDDASLQEHAQQRAARHERIESTGHDQGRRKGLSAEDYREAVQTAGSLVGASRLLEVHRSTVREMCVLHDIVVPSMGRVPD